MPTIGLPHAICQHSVDRDGRGGLRWAFTISNSDGTTSWAAARSTAHGQVLDLQAEHPNGFTAGTTGDAQVDAAISAHIAAVASCAAAAPPSTRGQGRRPWRARRIRRRPWRE